MKNILVTGISKGVGFAIAKLLLKENYTVFGVNRTISEDLKVLQKKYPQRLKILSFDLHETEKIARSVFKEFINLKVPIHGFINNAALAYDDIVTNINPEPLQKMYHVNVFSPFIFTKYVIRNMLLHQIEGSIVHISSISVHTGYKGLAMYASTKGAIEAFSKNTAREWGVRGIRSNCIVAGFMETGMSAGLNEEQKLRIYKRTSLKKETDIKSVADTALFLLSDKSKSATGQNFFIDSGTI